MGESNGETCCCGIGLQRGARLIAITDILVAFLTFFSLLFFQQVSQLFEKYFGDFDDNSSSTENEKNNTENNGGFYGDFKSLVKLTTSGHGENGNSENELEIDAILFLSLIILFTTIDICVSAILLHASSTKNKSACKFWFRCRVFLLISFIVYFFVVMGKSKLFLYGLVDILLIFYRVYCLCIVDSFMKQVDRENFRNSRRRISIIVPHVQVVTPDGSFSNFPASPSGNGQHFFTPPPLGSSRINNSDDEHLNGFNYSRLQN